MKLLKLIDGLAFVLVLVGAINWGLVGGFDINLVTLLFGGTSLAKLIYILVGISGVYSAFTFLKCCKGCGTK